MTQVKILVTVSNHLSSVSDERIKEIIHQDLVIINPTKIWPREGLQKRLFLQQDKENKSLHVQVREVDLELIKKAISLAPI
jgi:hypothetical protein